MLVRATRSFAPATGGPVNVGDVFDLPAGVDWLTAGLVEKADAKAAPTRAVEPPEAPEPSHQALRANVREQISARTGKPAREVSESQVEGGVKGVRDKKAAAAKKQARKKA